MPDAVDTKSAIRASDVNPGSQTDVQSALEEGALKFMALILQTAQSEVTSAINDTTSEPEAVG